MNGKLEATKSEVDYWTKLHAHTLSERDGKRVSVDTIKSSVLARLKELATAKHCSPLVVGWFSAEGVKGYRQRFGLKAGLPAKDGWDHPALALKGFDHIEDGALLTLSVLFDMRSPRVLAYSIGIQGKSKQPARAWYARIDLTEKPEGSGLCGHPLLHCHVGETSEEPESLEPAEPGEVTASARLFTARVPLPWMLPVDALDWLLATVHSPLDRTYARTT